MTGLAPDARPQNSPKSFSPTNSGLRLTTTSATEVMALATTPEHVQLFGQFDPGGRAECRHGRRPAPVHDELARTNENGRDLGLVIQSNFALGDTRGHNIHDNLLSRQLDSEGRISMVASIG